MLMIEPTPYILGLVRELRLEWNGELDVVFVGRNLSQDWGESGPAHDVLPPGLFQAGLEFWRRVASGRYALVHLAGWGHPLLMLGFLTGWVTGVPVTVESDTQLRPDRLGWRDLVKAVAYPLLFSIPRMFLPGGTRQAAYLEHFGVLRTRIRIAQMTVDVDAIVAHRKAMGEAERRRLRERMGLQDGQIAFLYVGRLEPSKGVRLLLEAFAALDEAGKDKRALVIVGAGSMSDEISRASGRLSGVVAPGRLAGKDLLDAYCSADVFVLPSLADQWGLVVNEAMAARLPVIVTSAVGCVDDLVVQGRTGVAVRPGSVDELRDAMSRLESSLQVREMMGKEAEKYIQPWTLRNEAARVSGAWMEAIRP